MRDNFEEFLTGITEVKGTGATDDRPIQEQAMGMLDQLAAMEEMMQTQTFEDVLVKIESRENPDELVTQEPPVSPPQYPSFQLD